MIERDIIQDFQAFIDEQPFARSQWSVGLAADAEDALFRSHDIDRHHGAWIYRMADNFEIAASVLAALIERGCTQAEAANADKGSYVYAFLQQEVPAPKSE